MFRKSIFLLLILTVVAGLVWPAPAYACSCAYDPDISDRERLDANVSRHKVVFAGTVLEQNVKPLDAVFSSSADPVQVSIDVDTVWKGQLPAQLTLTTARHDASCGYNFQTGQSYLIFASDYDGDGQLETGLCANNVALDQAERELELLGSGSAPTLPPAGGLTLTNQTVLLPALLVALFVSAALFVQRSRRRNQPA